MKHDTETRNPIFPCACCVLVDAHLLCCYWLELPLHPSPSILTPSLCIPVHPPLSIVYPPLHSYPSISTPLSTLSFSPSLPSSLSIPLPLYPPPPPPPPHPYVYALAFFLLPHTQPTPISRFVQGYIGAVTAAVGIAVSTIMLLAGGTCMPLPPLLSHR